MEKHKKGFRGFLEVVDRVSALADNSFEWPEGKAQQWVIAESMLLGMLLLVDGDSENHVIGALKEVLDALDDKDFINPLTSSMFDALRFVWSGDRKANAQLAYERYVSVQGDPEGIAYEWLVETVRNAPSSVSRDEIIKAADMVRKYRMEREVHHLFALGEKRIMEGYRNPDDDISTIIEGTKKFCDDLSLRFIERKSSFISTNEALLNAVNQIEKWHDDAREVTGLPSGFDDLDRITTGFHPGDLIIVAARPGMGKTAFATSIIANHARAENEEGDKAKTLNVGIFSLEMPSEQIVMRMISTLSGVSFSKIRKGKVADHEFASINMALGRLDWVNMMISDQSSVDINALRVSAIDMARQCEANGGALDLIIVDYLQLMNGSSGNRENRVQEVSEISRKLKTLAKELHIPVVALSQLNRSLEQRPDRRPRLSDLRESGSIEQDADIIISLYRDEMYNQNSEFKGLAEVSVIKNRHGPTDTAILEYRGECFRFSNRGNREGEQF